MDATELKRQIRGRELEVLERVAGIDPGLLDGKHHPCPKCGGTDRFRLIANHGVVLCNQCFHKNNGDCLAAVQWMRGVDFPEAIRLTCEYAGIPIDNGSGRGRPAEDPLDRLARTKRAPKESFRVYGANPNCKAVIFPAYGPDGQQCTAFKIDPFDKPSSKANKGLFARGRKAGLFFPHNDAGNVQLPQPSETWYALEGVKDAAALHALGLLAVGLNTSYLNVKFANLFRGVHVVLIPDLDRGGCKGAIESAEKLEGVAASVNIVRLPGSITEKDGNDLRDVLKAKGEDVVRDAIANPLAVSSFKAELEGLPITNAEFIKDDDGEGNRDALPIGVIIQDIRHRTGGQPFVANGSMFIHGDDYRPHWLEKPNQLFGYLHSLPGGVEWSNGSAMVGKGELFAELARTSGRFEAIEEFPHEPPIPGHYYACPGIEPGDGQTLREFLDFFEPEVPADRDLIQAGLMTMGWGGPGGARPLFFVTSKGRGSGKTTLAETLAEVWGGCIGLSMSEPAEKLKGRILSQEGLAKRAALLDNVKSPKLSWGDLEALVTCRHISGHRMYIGEARRPNTLTWWVTLNGISLSKDMAQRAVIIRIRPADYSGTWSSDVRAFLDRRRHELIADVIGALRGPRHRLRQHGRFGEWEHAVLERVPEPNEAWEVIEERWKKVDADAEESSLIVEAFRQRLLELHYDIERDRVFIPSRVAAEWHNAALGENLRVTAVSRVLNQLIEEGDAPHLSQTPTRVWGRGYVFAGDQADPNKAVRLDIEERISAI